uniref:Uncharacterized protein n=1 Tax=Rhizophora mucronata TaxID=61149 RepID=A0A2P2QCF1_RHIMU
MILRYSLQMKGFSSFTSLHLQCDTGCNSFISLLYVIV